MVTTHSDDVDLTCPFGKGASGYLPYASGGGAQAPGWLRRRAELEVSITWLRMQQIRVPKRLVEVMERMAYGR
jgi:hypothetical protein